LITRRRDPVDRRRHIVELSLRGGEELCLAYARLRFVEDDIFSALSDDERVTLYELLVRAVGTRVPPCNVVEEPLPCPA
jgi:DNA-binding MarR family transcriptional regulator